MQSNTDAHKYFQQSPAATPSLSNQFKLSLESIKDLYNPNNNTINLSKLTKALKLDTPLKDANAAIAYSRSRSSSIVDEQTSISDIINITLQKLKRRPAPKITGKL